MLQPRKQVFDLKKDKRFDDTFIEPTETPKAMKITWDNADNFASKVKCEKNFRQFAFTSGRFTFMDAVEAYIYRNNLICKRLDINTLSFGEDNAMSLKRLIDAGAVQQLNMIVATVFYAQNRMMIEKLYRLIDYNRCYFQFSVAAYHGKMIFFETVCGKKLIFYGSANMRSSDCVEQLTVEENEELYDFNVEFHDRIHDVFYTNVKEFDRRNSTVSLFNTFHTSTFMRGLKHWEKIKHNLL